MMTSAAAAVKRPLPPSPNASFLLGTIRRLQKDHLACMQAFVSEVGPAVRYRFILNMWGFLFVHPEHYRQILLDNAKNYTKLPHPIFFLLRPLIGNGLLSNDGESWLLQRRLVQPAFHRGQVDALGASMVAAAQKRYGHWERAARTGDVLPFDREMMELTLEIAGKTLFGADLTGSAREAGDAFSELNGMFAERALDPLSLYKLRIPVLPGTRRIFANIRILDSLIFGIVEHRRRTGALGDDLLGMLLSARDEETGEFMDEQQLRDEVMTLLIASHETTALLLTWLFYCLAGNPEVEARLHAEVDTALNGRSPGVDDLPKLTFTRQVVEETMRLYPPAYALSRYCNRSDVVGGYGVPADSMVTLSPYITHRLPEFWRHPHRFDPDRFSPSENDSRHRFAYIPFGAGPRQCIGAGFAMTEGVLVAASIAQRFRLRVPDGHAAELEPQVTLHPRGGMPLRFERR